MSQIGLVADEHDDNIVVGVIAQLAQPLLGVLVRDVLGNVVDEESTDGAAIVRARDRPVALLAGRVPDLSLYGFAVHLDAPRGELDTDRRLALQIELIARETREEIRLAHARVSD